MMRPRLTPRRRSHEQKSSSPRADACSGFTVLRSKPNRRVTNCRSARNGIGPFSSELCDYSPRVPERGRLREPELPRPNERADFARSHVQAQDENELRPGPSPPGPVRAPVDAEKGELVSRVEPDGVDVRQKSDGQPDGQG